MFTDTDVLSYVDDTESIVDALDPQPWINICSDSTTDVSFWVTVCIWFASLFIKPIPNECADSTCMAVK